jgi:hypothetical protein
MSTLWIVLSILLLAGAHRAAGGNFGDTPGRNGSNIEVQNSSKGINPVQHSE